MKQDQPVVFIIDDDPSVRKALERLFRSVEQMVHSFGSTEEFLRYERPDAPACLVLDVRLPGPGGLQFQQDLASLGVHISIVFITGHGDIPMSVAAMKAGAVEFLTKPFRDQDLLEAVCKGIERDRQRRREAATFADLLERFSSLTPREREVMGLVATGLLNKQIAAELGLSEITVKLHRAQVMQKMRAKSVADLVRFADRLGASVVNA